MALIREEINNDLLIKEVELRPPLYDKELPEYSDLQLKTRLWEDIAEILFPHTSATMTLHQKETAVRDIQKRWKNIRACYTRDVRQAKFGEPKRRKYVYFNKLQFLNSCIEHQDRTYRLGENETEENEYNLEDEEIDIKEETIQVPVDVPNNTERNNTDVITLVPEKCNEIRTELDPEANFALSLVPMLKAIPFCDKIDAHISILQVLKNYVKCEKSNFSNECSVCKNNIKTEIEYSDVEDT